MGELDLAATGGHGMEKLCVIKRVLPHLLVADNVRRFREEATMVMRLSHGNLVGVLDAGREEGQLYLAMDFVEGKDLLATWNQCATRQVAFPVEIAAYVIKELARGLGYAHAYRDLRLVHRDISPANVLLSYSGEVKLTDFGLAISKLKEQQTAPGIIYGKLAYLAPEQARGEPLDGRTDLYAAGILLWEMLTGRQLFPSRLPGAPPPGSQDGSATLDALERVRNPVVVPPSAVTGRVPADMNAIVMRALAVDPADRYQTGEDLRADLAAFLAKHAPSTDAATLTSFMTFLFQDQIDQEVVDRDALLVEASALLSGPLATTAAPIAPAIVMASPEPANSRSADHGLGLIDPALWHSAPGAPNGARIPNPAKARQTPPAALRTPAPAPKPSASTGDLADATPRPMLNPTPSARPESRARWGQRRGQHGDRRGNPSPTPGDDDGGDMPYRVYGGSPATDWADPAVPAAAGTADAPHHLAAAAREASRQEPFVDEDQRVGTTIAARYFLRRLCGEGAMGRVYEGHHVEIGRRVAIKILHSTFRHTPDVVERFRREARAASRIGHPNIVDVTDSGSTPDGAFFFVMEYLDGADLEQLIAREGPLPIQRALLIAAQVCRALVAAHAAGVIHRDLKPANVMLVRNRDDDDFVKVLDFGISKQSELDKDGRGKEVGLTRPDAAVGTPIYMAPEQVAGHPADGRTDVYAVGELLFEMLTGVPPYSGGDIIAVFNKKANEEPVPVRSLRPEVPAWIEELLVRAMSRLPAHRHASMTELKDDLLSGLARIEAAPVQPAPLQLTIPVAQAAATAKAGRVGPGPRSSRAMWITGAGIVVGLGLASMAILQRADLAGRSPAPALSPLAPTRVLLPGNKPPAGIRPAGREKGVGLPAELPGPATPSALPVPISARAQSPELTTPPQPVRAPVTTPASPTNSPRGAARRASPSAPRMAAAPAAARAPAPSLPPPTATQSQATAAVTVTPPEELARGRAAFAKGNFPEAVRLGRRALLSGDGIGAHLLLGDAFYKMDRFADALGEYDAVLKLAPTNPQARRGRELALRRQSH